MNPEQAILRLWQMFRHRHKVLSTEETYVIWLRHRTAESQSFFHLRKSHASAGLPDGGLGHVDGQCMATKPGGLASLGDVSVLAELTAQIATSRPERPGRGARMKVEERLLFDGIGTKP